MKSENTDIQSHGSTTCPAPERWEEYFDPFLSGSLDKFMESHLLECDRCLQEAEELLRDQRALRRMETESRLRSGRTHEPASFSMRGGMLVAVRGLVRGLGAVFRSGGRAVIHSDIIPLDADYVILELVNEEAGTRLKLEKGAKNMNKINISLYINESLSDNLQLQRSHSWDLNEFPHGSYTLDLEEKTVLKFELRE